MVESLIGFYEQALRIGEEIQDSPFISHCRLAIERLRSSSGNQPAAGSPGG
jgi:hypothetical protein